MVPEPVRRASQRLATLLGREGTSAGVAEGLQRAAGQLRIVGAGIGVEAELAALRAATSDLESCLVLIRASTNQVDRELEAGAARVHRSISRLLRPVDSGAGDRGSQPAPARAPAPAMVEPLPPTQPLPVLAKKQLSGRPVVDEPAQLHPPQRSLPAGWPVEPMLQPFVPVVREVPQPAAAPLLSPPLPASQATPTETPPECSSNDEEVILSHLSRLETLFRVRQRAAAEQGTTWADLLAKEAPIRQAMLGLSWMGELAGRVASTALEEAEDEDRGFAAALALTAAGGSHGCDRLLTRTKDSTLPPATLPGVLLALRFGSDISIVPRLEAMYAGVEDPALKTGLLRLLADRDRVTTSTLVALLDHTSDLVAATAAELLAWLGRDNVDRQAVESRALWRRSAPLLRAAVALGSAPALAAVREAIDHAEGDVACHIDTLAFAGDPTDSARLLRIVSNDGADSPLAALALTHLGLDPPSGATERLLAGQPWSLAGTLSLAASAGAPLHRRRWCALEAIVRSGQRPVAVIYDCLALPASSSEPPSGYRPPSRDSDSSLQVDGTCSGAGAGDGNRCVRVVGPGRKRMKAKTARQVPLMAVERNAVFEGRVTAVGETTIDAHIEPDNAVKARCPAHIDRNWLKAAVAVAPVDAAFVMPQNGGRAILLAVFPGPEHAEVRANITLVGRQVRIEAEEFRIQGRRAHVSVEKNGSVEVRGRDVTSRATRLNRIQGGAIRLN